jgi:hypothetical protein
MTIEFPATTDQYDQVNQKLGVPDEWPDGLILHSASSSDGNMKVVDIWESEAQFNAFNESKLMGAVQEVMGADMGDTPPQPPTIEELHNEFHAG